MKKKGSFLAIWLWLLCCTAFLGGCSHMVLLAPKGPIGHSERFVIITAFVLMLIVVIPVIVMAFWFPRKYRASNTKALYTPHWSHSSKIDLIVWLVPTVIVTALGTLAWTTTHQLDPYKPIDPGVKPINIDAVCLDWKWLFIYPDQHIATVNQIVFPANVPLSFRITSDTVMASFFIPQLGSQIYAMPGMQTRLHLKADESGVYTGQNQQLTGRGYAGMHFEAIATSPEQFDTWVEKARQSPQRLDLDHFKEISKPSSDCPVQFFAWVEPGLFEHIIGKYNQNMGVNSENANRKSAFTVLKSSAVEGR